MRSRSLTVPLLVLGALYLPGLFWGLPSILTPASDSIVPFGPLAFFARYSDVNISYVYPAVHQVLLACVYAPTLLVLKLFGFVSGIQSAWPHGFRDPSLVFSVLIFVSHLVSLLMGLGVLFIWGRLTPGHPRARLFTVLLLGLSGVFAYYARVGNMDMPYLFWWSVSFACLWRYLFTDNRARWLALSGAAAALSMGTKDQAVGLVFGLGLVLLVAQARRVSWLERLRQATLLTCVFLAVYAVAAILPQPARWWRHMVFVTSDHVLPETPATLAGYVELLGNGWDRLSHVLTPAGLCLGLAGLLWLACSGWRRQVLVLVLPALAYCLLIIVRVRATEERYLLPVAMVLAVGAGAAVSALVERALRAGRWQAHLVRLAAVTVLAGQFVYGFLPVTYCQVFEAKRAMARELPAYAPPGSSLLVLKTVTFGLPGAQVYERYRFVHPPGESAVPPSSQAEQLFHPFHPGIPFLLTSRPLEEVPGGAQFGPARLVKAWRYPEWIKRRVYVPAVYELYLYAR